MNQPTLFYFYDALCGWCYGFSPVINQIAAEFSDRLQIEVISGGMITGNRIGPIGEVAPYIQKAYRDVEKATGVTFGPAFLEGILGPGQAIFTSIPAAIALAAFREQRPEKTLAYATALQQAIYFDGVDPADILAFAPYAEPFGLAPAAFAEQLRETHFADLAMADFQVTARFGIQGFPSVVVAKDEKYYLMSRGYLPYAQLAEGLDKLLS